MQSAVGERVQDRPRWLGIGVRPAAAGAPGGLAAVGELQAEPEGTPGGGQVTRPRSTLAAQFWNPTGFRAPITTASVNLIA